MHRKVSKDGFNKGLVTVSVFIDLAKALDTVDYHILLSKLKYYGVCD